MAIDVADGEGRGYAWMSLRAAPPEGVPWLPTGTPSAGRTLGGVFGKYGSGEHGRVAFGGPAREGGALCEPIQSRP